MASWLLIYVQLVAECKEEEKRNHWAATDFIYLFMSLWF